MILKESCSGFGLKDGRFAFIAPLDVPAAACPHAFAAVRNYICSAKTDVNFNLSVLNVWRLSRLRVVAFGDAGHAHFFFKRGH